MHYHISMLTHATALDKPVGGTFINISDHELVPTRIVIHDRHGYAKDVSAFIPPSTKEQSVNKIHQ